uniref:RNA-directed DNA polymerase, eukaryota, reverse transcriptase zinc-binding domain protein n=1 Tax=Tanacetum cinerariifolium TaxID=118510 RepID=A0A699I366_TANCI|nr:hypothetical protein [Tanacetum cinerariifolium]
MGILVADDKVKSAATKLGCLMLNTPFSYLGTKVDGSMSRIYACDEVIDKVRSRLSRWKMKNLSIGGRLTLLKSVLGSMPIFHMSIFKAPISVIRQLESIRSHFFNRHDSASRFYSQNSSLWARVMKAIHGDDEIIGINFLDFMRLKLGNGNNISIWNDNWIRGNTLKNLYPRIYALENSKHVTVCAKLADIALDASFRRKPKGGSGDFSVASTRKAIDNKRLLVVNSKTC